MAGAILHKRGHQKKTPGRGYQGCRVIRVSAARCARTRVKGASFHTRFDFHHRLQSYGDQPPPGPGPEISGPTLREVLLFNGASNLLSRDVSAFVRHADQGTAPFVTHQEAEGTALGCRLRRTPCLLWQVRHRVGWSDGEGEAERTPHPHLGFYPQHSTLHGHEAARQG